MGKRDATKRANRAALLGAGRRVFATIGFEAATVRDIVRESGLAIGSFYNYFPGKEAVFDAIVDTLFDRIGEGLPAARQQAEDVEGFLHAAYQLVVDAAREDPESTAIIARNQTALRQRFYLGDARSGIQQALQKDLQDWLDAGRMLPHDPEPMSEAMISLGFDLLVHASSDPDTITERVAFVVELFRRALEPGAGA